MKYYLATLETVRSRDHSSGGLRDENMGQRTNSRYLEWGGEWASRLRYLRNGINRKQCCSCDLEVRVCNSDASTILIVLKLINVIYRADYDKYYNFTLLACQLNEMEEGIAPTDSRLRPDQRLMEEGRWQDANQIKQKLEEKQRTVRRQRESNAEIAACDGKLS
ncbi:hypothetical protein J6590_049046 [Homalodisca vitripennis]|nr:hypothetical protein J6590_049046 [Homalodisca vitripennis]